MRRRFHLTRDRDTRHRITVALVALWVAVSLPLTALPPEVWSAASDECRMSCSAEGQPCCCTKDAPPHAHAASGQDALSPVRLVSATERSCPGVNPFASRSETDTKRFLEEIRDGQLVPSNDHPWIAPEPPSSRSCRGDLARLPRPPPRHRIV